MLINLFGMALFLAVASWFWVEPELADLPGAGMGNAFGWFFFAAPIAVCFILSNVFLLLGLLWSGARSGEWKPPVVVAFTTLLWVAALAFDNCHHGA